MMALLSAGTFIRRVDQKVLSHRGFDSWTVLVQPNSNGQFAINPVASTIWDLADGQRTLAEIAAVLNAAYDDAPDTVIQDVIEWANNMAAWGLLESGPNPLL